MPELHRLCSFRHLGSSDATERETGLSCLALRSGLVISRPHAYSADGPRMQLKRVLATALVRAVASHLSEQEHVTTSPPHPIFLLPPPPPLTAIMTAGGQDSGMGATTQTGPAPPEPTASLRLPTPTSPTPHSTPTAIFVSPPPLPSTTDQRKPRPSPSLVANTCTTTSYGQHLRTPPPSLN